MPTDPRTDRAAFAAISALTVLTWYALPDAVRSRPARAVIKVGLLGVTAAGVTQIPRVYPDMTSRTPEIEVPGPLAMVGGLVVLGAGSAVTIWLEKVIFAAGERARARGVRCAHTPIAAALALATGAAALAGWPGSASPVEGD